MLILSIIDGNLGRYVSGKRSVPVHNVTVCITLELHAIKMGTLTQVLFAVHVSAPDIKDKLRLIV